MATPGYSTGCCSFWLIVAYCLTWNGCCNSLVWCRYGTATAVWHFTYVYSFRKTALLHSFSLMAVLVDLLLIIWLVHLLLQSMLHFTAVQVCSYHCHFMLCWHEVIFKRHLCCLYLAVVACDCIVLFDSYSCSAVSCWFILSLQWINVGPSTLHIYVVLLWVMTHKSWQFFLHWCIHNDILTLLPKVSNLSKQKSEIPFLPSIPYRK